tara:strand:- start:151 stop:444 length:294 start_codon:yes stop_codon:yes gene_type:complete
MAVGDIISVFLGVGGTTRSYVPAAGIEIVVTSAFVRHTTGNVGVQTSAGSASTDFDLNTSSGGRNPCNIKVGITNLTWLILYADTGSGIAFSGIQTK